MYEAIVGKILAAVEEATRRIYGRQRHFAPKWHFGSRNGGWEIVRLHATNAYVLFKRRVISFRKIEIMMTAHYMQMSDTSSCSGYRFYPLLSEMPRNGEGGVQKQWSPLNPRPPSRSLGLGWKSDAVIKLDDRFCTRPAAEVGEEGNMKMKGSIWDVVMEGEGPNIRREHCELRAVRVSS